MGQDLRKLMSDAASRGPAYEPPLDLVMRTGARTVRRRRGVALLAATGVMALAGYGISLLPDVNVGPEVATQPSPAADPVERALREDCAEFAVDTARRINEGFPQGPRREPPDLSGTKLIATMGDGAGSYSIFRGAGKFITCEIEEKSSSNRARGGTVEQYADGSPAPAELGADYVNLGYTNQPCRPESPPGCVREHRFSGWGVVPPGAVRVTLQAPGEDDEVDAIVRDGIWLVHHSAPLPRGYGGGTDGVTLRAYDAAGRVITELDP